MPPGTQVPVWRGHSPQSHIPQAEEAPLLGQQVSTPRAPPPATPSFRALVLPLIRAGLGLVQGNAAHQQRGLRLRVVVGRLQQGGRPLPGAAPQPLPFPASQPHGPSAAPRIRAPILASSVGPSMPPGLRPIRHPRGPLRLDSSGWRCLLLLEQVAGRSGGGVCRAPCAAGSRLLARMQPAPVDQATEQNTEGSSTPTHPSVGEAAITPDLGFLLASSLWAPLSRCGLHLREAFPRVSWGHQGHRRLPRSQSGPLLFVQGKAWPLGPDSPSCCLWRVCQCHLVGAHPSWARTQDMQPELLGSTPGGCGWGLDGMGRPYPHSLAFRLSDPLLG